MLLDTRGASVLPLRQGSHMKLSLLHKRYLADLRALGRSPQTISAYESDFGLLCRFTGRDDVRALTPETVADFARWLSEQGHKATSIGRRLASSSSFGDWLERRGELPKNPFRGIPRPKRRKSLPRAISTDQADKLAEAPLARDRAMVALMRYSGLRVGEVSALDLEDLGLDCVRVREGKGGRDRTVPLVPPVQVALADWLTQRGAEAGPVFPGVRGPRFSRVTISRSLNRAAKAAGVPHLTPHQLRHTFGTEMTQAGVELAYLQALMGHSDPATTMRYVQVTGHNLQAAMQRAQAWRDKQ